MLRFAFSFILFVLIFPLLVLAQATDPVAKAISQGDLFQSKRKYELALDSYHKADKLSHHTSGMALLKIAAIDIKMGDFPAALDDSKKAIKAAGEDKSLAIQAHLLRSTLLTQMAGKPTDKKLKEAEDEVRQALAIDGSQAAAHYDLGMILLKQERDADGIAELNTFISSPNAKASQIAEARRTIANPIRAREPFAPDFSFTSLEKEAISNVSLRGKVVLLDFWGTWCPPCRESVPILRSLNKKYTGKPFQLVGISSDDDEDVWRTFIDAQHMNWSEYIDISGEVLESFKIESFPTYIVLDKDGVVRYRQSGLGDSTQGDLEDAINKALKRNSDPALLAAASATAPTTSVAPSTDAKSTIPATSTATGAVSGSMYTNAELGFSFQYPGNWIVAKPESLQEVNDRQDAAAKAALLQQHPEMAGRPISFRSPRIIFYASRKGQGDGQQMSVPSLRITAVPTQMDTLNANRFREMTEQMAAGANMKIVKPALEFMIKDHQFLRADFERGSASARLYLSQIQTISGDSLLTIEILASSTDELERIAATLESMSIKEEN